MRHYRNRHQRRFHRIMFNVNFANGILTSIPPNDTFPCKIWLEENLLLFETLIRSCETQFKRKQRQYAATTNYTRTNSDNTGQQGRVSGQLKWISLDFASPFPGSSTATWWVERKMISAEKPFEWILCSGVRSPMGSANKQHQINSAPSTFVSRRPQK